MKIYVVYRVVGSELVPQLTSRKIHLFSELSDAHEFLRINNKAFCQNPSIPHGQWVCTETTLDKEVPFSSDVEYLSYKYSIPKNIVTEYMYLNDNSIENTEEYIKKTYQIVSM